MSTPTRVTLTGSRRRADVVLPSQATVGTLLPDVLQLLNEPPNVQPSVVVLETADGEVIGPEQSLAEAGVLDGAVLRVTTQADSWSAAVVLDVTDVVAARTTSRWEQWLLPTRQLAAGAAVVVSLLLSAWLLRGAHGVPAVLWLLGVAAAAAIGLGLVPRLRQLTVPLCLGGTLSGLLITSAVFDGSARLLWLAGLSLVFGGTAAATQGAGRPFGIGALVLVVLGGLWFVLDRTEVSDDQLASVVMTASVLALGVLPQVVLTLSGLARLDDRVVDGDDVTPPQVDQALRTAHRTVLLGVIAAVAVYTAAGLVVGASATRWALAAVFLTSVAVALRSRTFPLIIARLVCLAGPLLVVAAQLVRWAVNGGEIAAVVACALAIGVAGAVTLCWAPSTYLQARGRVAIDRLEAAVIVALIPVVVGSFGVYGRLLQVFS